jgi:AT-rich DNA-binding protein
VVIVGVGNLGHALAQVPGFTARGFRVAGLVDADPAKHGERVGDLVVDPMEELPRIVAERDVAIGIIATPAAVAQEVAQALVSAGVSSVLNFASAVITVPDGVSIRKVDLSIELQILSFYQQRRMSPDEEDRLAIEALLAAPASASCCAPAPRATTPWPPAPRPPAACWRTAAAESCWTPPSTRSTRLSSAGLITSTP